MTLDINSSLVTSHTAAQSNTDKFYAVLAAKYESLFKTDTEYEYAARFNSPEELARKMVNCLAAGTGNKDGKGIKLTCKELGIPYTYKGIRAYLDGK